MLLLFSLCLQSLSSEEFTIYELFSFFDYINSSPSPTEECHSPSSSTRIKSLAAAVTDLQHTLKGVDRGQDEAVCALGELAEQAFRKIFSGEKFMNPISYIFPYLENTKSIKIFVPCGQQ